MKRDERSVDSTCSTPDGARNVSILVLQQARLMIADGKRVRIRCEEAADVRSLRQNAFYWGHVLNEISLQAVNLGERWIDEAWHQLFKRMFLGYRYEREEVVGRPPRAVRVLRSTTELSVKQMSAYLEQVIAFGVTDFAVQFETMDWQKWEEHGGRR